MNTTQFAGLWTALITPFKEGNGIDNEVDYIALEKLLNMQIDGGVNGVLLLGTTAENPTLTKEEALKIVKFAINILKGKTKIMVNVGTYSTKVSLDNVKEFDEIDGIDSYLVVNPYYNKPTQTGLKKHFITIAKYTKTPIFLYNIKGRTGVNLETGSLLEIVSECSNVIGVKEASGNLEQMIDVINKTDDDFIVLSGDDSMSYDLIKKGGDGVISVASNCIPEKMSEFIESCLSGDEKASDLNNYYNDFFDKLFIQTNPLPAKTFLAYKGIIKEEFRLPICRMDDKEKEEFLEVCKKYNYRTM